MVQDYKNSGETTGVLSIQGKLNDGGRFYVQVCNDCNMNCSFCIDNNCHLKKEEIIEYYKKIDYDGFQKALLDFVEKTNMSDYKCIFLGGELFYGKTPNEILNKFADIYIRVSDKCKEIGKTFTVLAYTNLTYEDTSFLDNFMDRLRKGECNVKIRTSYNMCGRFASINQLHLFEKNCFDYEKDIEIIELTPHKEEIQYWLNLPDDEFAKEKLRVFERLYNSSIELIYECYLPSNDNYKRFSPTTDERLEFEKFMYDHYPKMNELAELEFSIKNNIKIRNRGGCTRFYLFSPSVSNDYSVNCVYEYGTNRYLQDRVNGKSLEKITLLQMRELNCLGCDNYKYCPLACPMLYFIKDVNNNSKNKCYHYDLINYIKGKLNGK